MEVEKQNKLVNLIERIASLIRNTENGIIEEKGIVVFKCEICNLSFFDDLKLKPHIKSTSKIQFSFQHHGYPLTAECGTCCDKCNESVIEARQMGLCRTDEIIDLNDDCVKLGIDFIEEKLIKYIEHATRIGILKTWVEDGDQSLRAEAMEVFDCVEFFLIKETLKMNAKVMVDSMSRHIAKQTYYTTESLSLFSLRSCLGTLMVLIDCEDLFQKIEVLIDRYTELEHKKADLIGLRILEEEEATTKKQTKCETESAKTATRNANKERDAKKREREEYEDQVRKCAIEQARQDALKKQKKAQQKAKSKK